MKFLKKKSAFAHTALAVAAIMSAEAYAKAIQGISATQISDNTTQLRINFDSEPVTPTASQMAGSNQLMLDFAQVSSKSLPRNMPINRGVVNNVTAVNGGSVTRLLVGLNGTASYSSEVKGNQLLINVVNTGGAMPMVSPNSSVQPAYMGSDDGAPIQPAPATAEPIGVRVNPLLAPTTGSINTYNGVSSINYSANGKNGGKVTVALANESVPVDVQRQGNKIVIRTQGATIPRHLLRHIQAGGLVSSINAVNQGQSGLITINMSSDYEYQAYQAGSSLHVSVLPPKPVREPTIEEKVYTGEPLSMEFQDVSVRTVLDVLGQFTESNIVASDEVTGNITLRLINVPWDQALDIILKSKDLDKRKNGNVILVAPAAKLRKEEEEILVNEQKKKNLAPLRTEYIRLNYAKAEDVIKLLDDADSPGSRDNGAGTGNTSLLESERGVITADGRTNTIIIKDTSKGIESIRAMIDKIDIPVKQVMIEARIVTASDSFSKEIGVRWGNTGRDDDSRKALSTKSTNLSVDLGVANATSAINIGLLSISDMLLNLNLSALQAEGKGEVLSAPKVLTADKQKARIHSGIQIPYQEASASGATTVTFKEAGITLEATPSITPDGKITVDLDVKNGSDTGERVVGVPILREDQLTTRVILEDGQTVVLGGVFRNSVTNGQRKVPFLGSVPGVGRLFRNDTRVNEKQELLIFITPKLINDGVSRIN